MSRNRKPGKVGGDPAVQKSTKKRKQSGKHAWKMMDRAATIVAGMVAQRATATVWRAATGKKPPASSQHPELSKAEAISWAIFAGAAVELSKVLIHRATADYWVRSTGQLPPGMKPMAGRDGHEKPAGPRAGEPAGGASVRSRNRDK